MHSQQHFHFPTYKCFFGIAFIFSLLLAIFFQKIVMPMWPDMHAGLGLLKNDAIVFHEAAAQLSKSIQAHGWSHWSMYPPGYSGNVSILSVVYTILGPNPIFFLPITASLHALSAALIYSIGFKVTKNDTGKIAGLIAGVCFVAFPSSLQWYAQNHKDSFAIAGTLILLETWLTIISFNAERIAYKELTFCFIKGIIGVLLIGIVRPYFVLLTALGLTSSFILVIAFNFFTKSLSIKQTLHSGFFVFVILSIGFGFTHIGSGERVYSELDDDGNRTYDLSKNFQWKSSPTLPKVIDEKIRRAAELRVHFVEYGISINAGSDIDSNQLPDSAWDVAKYLPRATVIGLFAPFPNAWNDRVTATRLVGSIETCFWYVFFAGVFIALWKYGNKQLFACVAFCVPVITILAFIHPNIGTLYRQRYGFWQILLLIGAVGWSTIIMHFIGKEKHSETAIASKASAENKAYSFTYSKIMSSGFIVILITTCCYIGFFARDLILVSEIGLNNRLDAFFTAMMIPMFFVTCFAMPVGDLITKLFSSLDTHAKKQSLIASVMGWSFWGLSAITFLIILFAPDFTGLILEKNQNNIAEATTLLRLFAPILAFSAWSIIGNAILNSLGQQKQAATGQLIVPIITIVAILIADHDSVLIFSVSGMLIGTIFNILWISRCLKLTEFTLIPKLNRDSALREPLKNYFQLAISAFFPAALIPINYAFAASVGEGHLSAWAFASKVVLLFTGIATAFTTSVLLPYFSTIKQINNYPANHIKILLGTCLTVGVCFTLMCFIFTEPIVVMTIGKGLTESQLFELITIVRISLLQIPVMIGFVILNKQAVANNHTSILLLSALITFTVNLLSTWILVPKIGVLGVSIGALAGILAGFTFFYFTVPNSKISQPVNIDNVSAT